MIKVKDLGMLYPKETSRKKERYALYRCPICKENFKTMCKSVETKKTTKCRKCASSKHFAENERLLTIWNNMKKRCYSDTDKYFYRYGGRGITVCDEWLDDYKNFENWALSNGYLSNLKIDRRDNDKDYTPNNCRWSTQEVQSQNSKLLRSTNTSGFRGVNWSKANNTWVCRSTLYGERVNIGTYKTKEEAGQAYDDFVIENNLEHPLNFPQGGKNAKRNC